MTNGSPSGGPADPADAPPSTAAAEIEAVLADPDLSPEERDARIRALAAEYGLNDRGGSEKADELSPIEMQIAEALSMLAEGGHGYAPADAPQDDAGPSARRPSDEGESFVADPTGLPATRR